MKLLLKIAFIGNVVITALALLPGIVVGVLEGEIDPFFFAGAVGAFFIGIWQLFTALLVLALGFILRHTNFRSLVLYYLTAAGLYFAGWIPFVMGVISFDTIWWLPALGVPFGLYVAHFYFTYITIRHA